MKTNYIKFKNICTEPSHGVYIIDFGYPMHLVEKEAIIDKMRRAGNEHLTELIDKET